MHRRTTFAIAAALAAAGTTYAAENPDKIYSAMMPQTRADAQARVKAMFDRIDANHDGVITLAEFDAYRSARLAEWQAKGGDRRDRAFAAMDTDQNGQVSKAEFDSFATSDKANALRHIAGAGMVRERSGGRWFDRADVNHDGKITLDEAQSSAMALFDAADADHNGTVTPEERRMAWAKARAARLQQN
jgi:Ca2+-binding EF-hand superfamily protein